LLNGPTIAQYINDHLDNRTTHERATSNTQAQATPCQESANQTDLELWSGYRHPAVLVVDPYDLAQSKRRCRMRRPDGIGGHLATRVRSYSRRSQSVSGVARDLDKCIAVARPQMGCPRQKRAFVPQKQPPHKPRMIPACTGCEICAQSAR
jgi:hypothetical protein